MMSSPVLSETVNTRVEHDALYPALCGVSVLDVGGVVTTVVTDSNNNCVKSFYTRNNKTCHSRLQLNYPPVDITQLGDNKVIVTVPQQLVTVAVTPDLVHVNHIDTSKTYTSVAVITPTTLAASGGYCVDILNMQGEVMKTITTLNNMALFNYSHHMCVNNRGQLLVLDWAKRTVTCLTPEGRTVWIHSGADRQTLVFPRGITTSGGDILVADRSFKKVVQLSVSGEYVRDVLTSQDGLRDPEGICVDKHGTLIVCDSGELLKFVFMRK